jgi:hypothetical protein
MIDRDVFLRELLAFKEQMKKVNPDRIPEIMDELKALWEENSDLRFGQLLSFLLETIKLEYIEDEDLLDKIKRARRDNNL